MALRSGRFTFEADSVSISRARHVVTRFARQHGVPAERLGDIALAVSEACTNVVLHAYRDGEKAGSMSIGFEIQPKSLRVYVGDTGTGMRPRRDSPGLGLGLPIIAGVADALAVEPGANGGTDLLMRFDLPPLAAS